MGSIYSDITSGLLQRGEDLFPFSCFKVKRDWDEILKELMKLEWDTQEDEHGASL